MEDSSCQSVRNALWDQAGGLLAEDDARAVASHLLACRQCARLDIEVSAVSDGLRRLPVLRPPAIISMRVKVAASRDRSHRLLRLDLAARWKEFRQRARLVFDNLFKPLAVPAAGGILASMLCFGVIVDNLHLDPTLGQDMPIGVYRTAIMDDVSPFCFTGKDVLVQLTIDRNGNVIDWTPQQALSPDEQLEIGNVVLYSTFKPAWASGQPITSKILLLIQHSTIRG